MAGDRHGDGRNTDVIGKIHSACPNVAGDRHGDGRNTEMNTVLNHFILAQWREIVTAMAVTLKALLLCRAGWPLVAGDRHGDGRNTECTTAPASE